MANSALSAGGAELVAGAELDPDAGGLDAEEDGADELLAADVLADDVLADDAGVLPVELAALWPPLEPLHAVAVSATAISGTAA
jgi:hypothetical protein